jgi:hypothetical protein
MHFAIVVILLFLSFSYGASLSASQSIYSAVHMRCMRACFNRWAVPFSCDLTKILLAPGPCICQWLNKLIHRQITVLVKSIHHLLKQAASVQYIHGKQCSSLSNCVLTPTLISTLLTNYTSWRASLITGTKVPKTCIKTRIYSCMLLYTLHYALPFPLVSNNSPRLRLI